MRGANYVLTVSSDDLLKLTFTHNQRHFHCVLQPKRPWYLHFPVSGDQNTTLNLHSRQCYRQHTEKYHRETSFLPIIWLKMWRTIFSNPPLYPGIKNVDCLLNGFTHGLKTVAQLYNIWFKVQKGHFSVKTRFSFQWQPNIQVSKSWFDKSNS